MKRLLLALLLLYTSACWAQTVNITSIPAFTGDCTNSGQAITCTKTNGVAFGTFATANALTPPNIGSTTPSTGKFTNLTGTTSIAVVHTAFLNTAPTISSGFGTGASISNSNGTGAFRINVGTGGPSSGVVGMPAAQVGWNCQATDVTTESASVSQTKQTASTTTTVTLGNFSDLAVSAAWTDSDILAVQCIAY